MNVSASSIIERDKRDDSIHKSGVMFGYFLGIVSMGALWIAVSNFAG